MPLSPHFILPAPCTFMTSRSVQSLPGVRELFPDLFHTRSMSSPHTPPLSTIHDLPQPTPHDVTNSQVELPYNPSTAQHTTAITSDQSHPYTRVRTPAHFRLQPRTPHPPTQRWPKPNTVPCTSPTSATPPLSPLPQFPYPEYGAGPSILLDNEQLSSPMTSSPHIPSTELPPQPTTSLESHSGKKRHKCNVCGSYWGRPSSLKIHMVSHTGVKEFVCPICKQDFGVKSNYTRHVRVHHKDSSEGAQTRVAVRRRRGSRRSRDAGPVRFVDEGPRFQGQ